MLPEYALIYLRSWLQFSDYFCSFQVTELLLINLVYGLRSTTKILDLQDGFCHQTPTYLWFLISTLRHSIKLWLESLIVSKMNFNLGMPSKKICPEGDIGTFSIFLKAFLTQHVLYKRFICDSTRPKVYRCDILTTWQPLWQKWYNRWLTRLVYYNRLFQ